MQPFACSTVVHTMVLQMERDSLVAESFLLACPLCPTVSLVLMYVECDQFALTASFFGSALKMCDMDLGMRPKGPGGGAG